MLQYMADKIAGRLHVHSSNRRVIRECWGALSPRGRKHNNRAARRRFYRAALKALERNRRPYERVQFGRL